MERGIDHAHRAPFVAAGRTWELAQGSRLAGGTGLELAVANALCATAEPLSGEELQFLCRVSGVRNVDIAARLAASRSNVTYWMAHARTMPYWVSIALKKWFWMELFAARVPSGSAVPLAMTLDDRALLAHLGKLVVETGLVALVAPRPRMS